jgi:hypothetical protein
VPSRYPPLGLFDAVASADDLAAVIELEGWTDDRISTELGLLFRLPAEEWVVGRPLSSVVMAAYCHTGPCGGRFNDSSRGAWYAARTIDTAHAEVLYHRGLEFAEIGLSDSEVQMREYLADCSAEFHDLRAPDRTYACFYESADYSASQDLARDLLDQASNGIVYRSLRDPGGECLACFRPKLVKNVRQGRHFVYRWRSGTPALVRQVRGNKV